MVASIFYVPMCTSPPCSTVSPVVPISVFVVLVLAGERGVPVARGVVLQISFVVFRLLGWQECVFEGCVIWFFRYDGGAFFQHILTYGPIGVSFLAGRRECICLSSREL